jgi:hypothetical protein
MYVIQMYINDKLTLIIVQLLPFLLIRALTI